MKSWSKSLSISLFLFVPAPGLWAITPMEYFHNLVAGGEGVGYRDGDFNRALFNHSQGMAFNVAGDQLFVADTMNNRIRVIYLSEKNRVGTLAGKAEPGAVNGTFQEATFNRPTAMVALPGNRLVVFDSGTRLLRLLDLSKGQVSTLTGDRPETALWDIWDMVFRAEENALYFTEPDVRQVRRLDLRAGTLTMALASDPLVPNPRALCPAPQGLYLADWVTGDVYLAVPPTSASVTAPKPLDLKKVGHGDQIWEMACSGDHLYAFQGNQTPLVRILPGGDPVDLATPWGHLVNKDNPDLFPLLHLVPGQRPGMIISATDHQKLIISSGWGSALVSVRDLEYRKNWTDRASADQTGKLADFTYPVPKPPRTIRILVVGSSYVVTSRRLEPSATPDEDRLTPHGLKIDLFGKRLEFLLNVQSSLEDKDVHYEVLLVGRPGNSIQVFGVTEIPPLVEKYDIDWVLAVVPGFSIENYNSYYLNAMTGDGIPGPTSDPEYILKPWRKRVPAGPAADLIQRGMKMSLIKEDSAGHLQLPLFYTLLGSGDPVIREDLLEMIGKPFQVLRNKLVAKKGVPFDKDHLVVCYVPDPDDLVGNLSDSTYEEFWTDLTHHFGLNLLDLAPEFNVLKINYYPVNELCCHNHYTAYGNDLIATLLAHHWGESGFTAPQISKGKEKP